ncbi:hypothetical protein GW17_00036315, partial [Ensete ventricosum]
IVNDLGPGSLKEHPVEKKSAVEHPGVKPAEAAGVEPAAVGEEQPPPAVK